MKQKPATQPHENQYGPTGRGKPHGRVLLCLNCTKCKAEPLSKAEIADGWEQLYNCAANHFELREQGRFPAFSAATACRDYSPKNKVADSVIKKRLAASSAKSAAATARRHHNTRRRSTSTSNARGASPEYVNARDVLPLDLLERLSARARGRLIFTQRRHRHEQVVFPFVGSDGSVDGPRDGYGDKSIDRSISTDANSERPTPKIRPTTRYRGAVPIETIGLTTEDLHIISAALPHCLIYVPKIEREHERIAIRFLHDQMGVSVRQLSTIFKKTRRTIQRLLNAPDGSTTRTSPHPTARRPR